MLTTNRTPVCALTDYILLGQPLLMWYCVCSYSKNNMFYCILYSYLFLVGGGLIVCGWGREKCKQVKIESSLVWGSLIFSMLRHSEILW